ncbi:MAG: metallophosphoesterase [Myxococcales bacterium]|nr:metallophosphoesterase [Myxococcales bacterium]
MSDWVPQLQILHISDRHNGAPAFRPPIAFYQFALALHRLSPDYAARLLTAVVPHDPFAIDALAAFVREWCADDPSWEGRPLWLVDTGDLTSFGDDASVELAGAQLETLRRALAPNEPERVEVLALYGNHDAWPGDQPLNLRSEAIDSHRSRLREAIDSRNARSGGATEGATSRISPVAAANGASDREHRSPWRLRCEPDDPKLPGVDLYGLNTVLHDRWRSFLAVGELGGDRLPGSGEPDDGLDQLSRLAAQIAADDERPRLRIVATHHPLHFPPPRPTVMMHLANDEEVGRRLTTLGRRGVQLALAGHVHQFYPRLGELPAASRDAHFPPLPVGSVPLLVGSLSQTSLAPTGFNHQAQLLRFFAKPGEARLRCRRQLIARAGGQLSGSGAFGRFALVPTAVGAAYDEIEFDLA